MSGVRVGVEGAGVVSRFVQRHFRPILTLPSLSSLPPPPGFHRARS